MKLLFLALTVISLSCFYLYAPHYLAYMEWPAKSEAIIVLVGNDDANKFRRAQALLDAKLSDQLIVPSRVKFKLYNNDISIYDANESISSAVNCTGWHIIDLQPEETHIEMLIAKGKMERENISSAMVISHPFHMRRVKIIASKVFRNSAIKIHFVPSKELKTIGLKWLLNKEVNGWVFSELTKIAWFSFYSSLPWTCYSQQ